MTRLPCGVSCKDSNAPSFPGGSPDPVVDRLTALPPMLEDRGYKRTFYGAPRSVTSLLPALLEPPPAVAIDVKLGSPGLVIIGSRRSASGRIVSPLDDSAAGCLGKLRLQQ